MQDAVYTLQGRLKPLAVSSTISQVNRLQYQGILAEIDDKAFRMELVSNQMIKDIEAIGIYLQVEDQGETMNFLTLYNENGASIYGDCFVPMTWPVFDKYISETGA